MAKELEAFRCGKGSNKFGIAAIQVPVGPMSRDERLGEVQQILTRAKTIPQPQMFVFLNQKLRSMVRRRRPRDTQNKNTCVTVLHLRH